MKTSERLDQVVTRLQDARRDMRRLALDLPDGATLEKIESAEAKAGGIIKLLGDEARILARGND